MTMTTTRVEDNGSPPALPTNALIVVYDGSPPALPAIAPIVNNYDDDDDARGS